MNHGARSRGFAAIYAEGHLLTGANARVSVAHDCASDGSGTFPHQCNGTIAHHRNGASSSAAAMVHAHNTALGDVHGCEVQSVAGRAGANYLVALAGETPDAAGCLMHILQSVDQGRMQQRVWVANHWVSSAPME